MILFSHTFSSLPLFFQFTGWPSALKKNPFLKTLSVVPKTLPFFFSFRVAFGIKKKFTFQSHFHFLPPSHTLSVPSLFFFFFPGCLPPSKKNNFFYPQPSTAFLFSFASFLPFFPPTLSLY